MTGWLPHTAEIPTAGPMFDSDPGVLDVAPLALAVVGFAAGLLWLRRITRGEPEGGSFRATASARRESVVMVAVVLLAALVGLAAYALATR